MQRGYVSPHVARHFALGIALIGLLLAFLSAALLVFPHKLAANPEVQGALLYDLLGMLEYRQDGHFGPVDDPAMQQNLKRLIAQRRLNGRDGVAYILNRTNAEIVWQSAPAPVTWRVEGEDNAYALQFKQTATHQLAIQNFWLRATDSTRVEFRMVVALPLH